MSISQTSLAGWRLLSDLNLLYMSSKVLELIFTFFKTRLQIFIYLKKKGVYNLHINYSAPLPGLFNKILHVPSVLSLHMAFWRVCDCVVNWGCGVPMHVENPSGNALICLLKLPTKIGHPGSWDLISYMAYSSAAKQYIRNLKRLNCLQ